MRCSRYRPISEGATGRPPIYPTGSNPKGFNQRDLPYEHHTRGWPQKDGAPLPAARLAQLLAIQAAAIQPQRVKRRDLSCEAAAS
jgi:hypothetical protein